MVEHRSKTTPREKWEWFGYAGHFICADQCRFTLCTKVGNYLIPSVGDMTDARSGERTTIGADDDSFFETYVFKAGPRCTVEGCGCGQPTISGSEIDGERCATGEEAQKLHMKYCNLYASKKP